MELSVVVLWCVLLRVYLIKVFLSKVLPKFLTNVKTNLVFNTWFSTLVFNLYGVCSQKINSQKLILKKLFSKIII